MWETLMSDSDKMGKFLKRYSKKLRKQSKMKDTKSIHLSGELNMCSLFDAENHS